MAQVNEQPFGAGRQPYLAPNAEALTLAEPLRLLASFSAEGGFGDWELEDEEEEL